MKAEIKKFEHLTEREKKKRQKKLKLRAIAISNKAFDKDKRKGYSVQFYDYDKNGAPQEKIREDIVEIMKIFPYDCLMYETKHGIHFISFSLLKGYARTKGNVIKLTKKLKNQDYWSGDKTLALRVSAKWRTGLKGKKRKEVSYKPRFKGLIKPPNRYRISNNHLEFYYKFMGLPKWVYEQYKDCYKSNFQIAITHYKTRD